MVMIGPSGVDGWCEENGKCKSDVSEARKNGGHDRAELRVVMNT